MQVPQKMKGRMARERKNGRHLGKEGRDKRK